MNDSPGTAEPELQDITPRELLQSVLDRARRILTAFGFLVLAYIVGGLTLSAVGLPLGLPPEGSPTALALDVFALHVIGFGTVSVAYLWSGNGDWQSYLCLYRPGRKEAESILTVVGVLLAVMAVFVVAINLAGLEANSSRLVLSESLPYYAVAIVLSVVIVGPVEEIFFRGIVQNFLAERLSVASAIAIASVIFTLPHTGAIISGDGQFTSLLLVFAMGIILGCANEWSGNLVVPVVAHGIFNAIQYLLRVIQIVT